MKLLSYTVLALGCVHIPFADNNAIKIFMKLLAQVQPKQVVLAGDILDCREISSFPKLPRNNTFQYELDETKKFLEKIRVTAPTSEMVYLQGNHEFRIKKYLASQAKELASLKCLSLEQLLGFDSLGIQSLDYGQYHHITPSFVATHGTAVRANSGASALAELKKAGCSGLSFHTHRMGTVHTTNYSGTQSWTEGGCLAAMDQEYVKGIPDWQQGFLHLTVIGDQVTVEPVQIRDGMAVFRGVRYSP